MDFFLSVQLHFTINQIIKSVTLSHTLRLLPILLFKNVSSRSSHSSCQHVEEYAGEEEQA